MTVKMPDPMTAPMPSAVSDHGPSVLLSRFSGFSESEISLSIDFLEKICEGRIVLLVIDYGSLSHGVGFFFAFHGPDLLGSGSYSTSMIRSR